MVSLDRYDYTLPPELIAQEPASPRDSARLFVYDTKTDSVTLTTFVHLAEFLPQRSLLVLNNTRVIPARVIFRKETGGAIAGLLLLNEGFTNDGEVRAIAVKTLPVGKQIFLGSYAFFVEKQEEQIFFLKPQFPKEDISTILDSLGTTPIPPYIERTLSETTLRERYQTIFAKQGASIAAPTASLHFTDAVFSSLQQKHINSTFVTLDVGMGTFAPVSDDHIQNKRLHTEKLSISGDSVSILREAKKNQTPIIAVGTTVVRTLESSAEKIISTTENTIEGDTNLFIMPPYDFKMVDSLVTNFHVPRSSLLCLVDAFLEHKKAPRGILDLYKVAINEKFRFFSFGDSMLIK